MAADDDVPPDIEIGARVTARRLRSRARPRAAVEVRGELIERDRRIPADTLSGSERANLPDEVAPGVDYADIRISWRAAARIRDVRSFPPPDG